MTNKRALLVIDMQQGIKPLYNQEKVLNKINERINHFRNTEDPVIFIQHEEKDLPYKSGKWQLDDQLATKQNDYYIRKTHPDAFYKTQLEPLLKSLNINELEICGAEVPFCVDTTIKVAFDFGYKIFMTHGTVSTVETVNELIPLDILYKHYEYVWKSKFLTFLE